LTDKDEIADNRLTQVPTPSHPLLLNLKLLVDLVDELDVMMCALSFLFFFDVFLGLNRIGL